MLYAVVTSEIDAIKIGESPIVYSPLGVCFGLHFTMAHD